MSNKNLTILGILAAAMIIWAVVQSRLARRTGPPPAVATHLIQGMNLAEIAQITLGAGDDIVTLKRLNNQFVITNKNNYPAVTKQINSLITDCLDIQAGELVTANPENHAELEVTEDKAKNVVKFLDQQGQMLTGLVVGKNDTETGGTYVRLVAEDKVYRAERVPWIRKNALDYAERTLIELESPDDIVAVNVTYDQGSYTIKAGEKHRQVLQDVPAEKKQKGHEVQEVFTALDSFNLTDIISTDEGLNFDHTYTCCLKNSTVYTVKIAHKEEKYFVKISAEFTDKTPVVKEERQESEEELKKKEAILLAQENAAKFNQKHQGWIYEIASWSGKNLTKKFADLIEDQEKPKEDEEKASAEEKDTAEIKDDQKKE